MASDIETAVEAVKALLVLHEASKTDKPAGKTFANIEAGVEYSGKKIILPDDPSKMSYTEAREWLVRLERSEQATIAINEIIDCQPWDGAVAMMKAMHLTYGWAQPVPNWRFWGEDPPAKLSIDTDLNETTAIFWGNFRLPGIDGYLQTAVDIAKRGGKMRFAIRGQVKRKHLEAIQLLVELTRKIVVEQSIYRGKAIRLELNNDGSIDLNQPPKFMDLSKVDESELVFSAELQRDVEANLYTHIEHTAQVRKRKVPLKRGVLLEGPYGTGKTMCASIVALKCSRNGWTFVTVPAVSGLATGLQFAAAYPPCVLFVEDIDREMTGERTKAMDAILNVVDGIVSKNTEVMVVLTSNHADMIHKAMVRPGRLDVVLHIGPPDAEAVQKLLHVYGRGLIKKDADLSKAGAALAGRIPAVIRECVEKAKLYAIAARPDADFMLTDDDLVDAARSMKAHLALLDGPPADEQTSAAVLAESLGRIINQHLGNGDDEGLAKKVSDMQDQIKEIHDHLL